MNRNLSEQRINYWRKLIYRLRNNMDILRYASYFERKEDVEQRELIMLPSKRARSINLRITLRQLLGKSRESIYDGLFESLPFLYRFMIVLNFCVGLIPLLYLFFNGILPFRAYSLLCLSNINWTFLALVIFLLLVRHMNAHFKYIQIQNNSRETLISCLFNDVPEYLEKNKSMADKLNVLDKPYVMGYFLHPDERLAHPTILENYELRLLGDEDGSRIEGLIRDWKEDPSLLFVKLHDRYDLFPRQEFLTSRKNDFDSTVRRLNTSTLRMIHQYVITRDWLFRYNVFLRLPAVFILGFLIGLVGPLSTMMIPLWFWILSYPIMNLIEHVLSKQDYLDLKDAVTEANSNGNINDLLRKMNRIDKMNHYEPYLLPWSEDRIQDDSWFVVFHYYLKYRFDNDRFWEPLSTGVQQGKNNLVGREILTFVGFFLLGIPMGFMLTF